MKRVYIVRHPEITMHGRYIGITDSELSKTGRKQLYSIINYFKDIHLETIVSSPMKRCIIPTRILSDIKHVPYTIDPDLSEIDFGAWEGLSYKEIMEKYHEGWAEYMARPLNFTFPGGDDVSQYIDRCVKNFKNNTEGIDGDLLFLTHAGYINSIISAVFLKDGKQFFNVGCKYATGYLINERGFSKIL